MLHNACISFFYTFFFLIQTSVSVVEKTNIYKFLKF